MLSLLSLLFVVESVHRFLKERHLNLLLLLDVGVLDDDLLIVVLDEVLEL
jgi:hypothetical protein